MRNRYCRNLFHNLRRSEHVYLAHTDYRSRTVDNYCEQREYSCLVFKYLLFGRNRYWGV